MDQSTDGHRAWARLRSGDKTALAELFGQYRPQLRRMVELRIAGRLTRRVDPSDILQETFMDASQKIDAYVSDPRVTLFVWLRGLTLDRLLKVQRRHLGTQSRDILRELRLPAESSLALGRQLLAGGPTPSGIMEQGELRRQVAAALQQLNDRDREVLVMRHFEGMSNLQVAEALEIAATAATMRHGRALKRLKDILTARLPSGESS
ncbi:sigma-70 family RNA polymerase sigma factor [Symmachiella dynata]|uniref:sigma-70 family RNA polymerase sigma factor n=1 Tax=Symmachiella dynata TaxID=2527995 RepID=UPI0011A3BBE7|nr:sigma-70 family RNA polymerase sigma factor [Symmachiella dynata]